MRAGGPALLFERVEGLALPAADQHLRHAAARVVGAGRRRSRRARARDPRAGEVAAADRPDGQAAHAAEAGARRRRDAEDRAHARPASRWSRPTSTSARCRSSPTWPGDGGPYITLPMVITRDPDKGTRNVGCYRMQVYDKRDDRHALAAAQDRAAPHAPLQGARPAAHAGGGRAGRRSGAALRGDGAAARRHRRVPVRRLPAPQAGRDGALQDHRPGGAGVGRLRAGGLRRRRRAAPRRAVRRPHRLLLAGRRLPGLPPHRDHPAREPDLRDDRRRAAAAGGRLAGQGDGAAVPAALADDVPRDRRHEPADRGRASTTSASSRSRRSTRTTRARSAIRCGAWGR